MSVKTQTAAINWRSAALKAAALAPAFLLLSCATPRAYFQKRIYKPDKSGVIRYRLDPVLFQPDIVQQRRMDAQMKMDDFCRPKQPEILSENKKVEIKGHRTSTSHRDYSDTHSSSVSSLTGVPYYSSSRVSSGGQNRSRFGGSETVSAPITDTYNVISFACK